MQNHAVEPNPYGAPDDPEASNGAYVVTEEEVGSGQPLRSVRFARSAYYLRSLWERELPATAYGMRRRESHVESSAVSRASVMR